MSLFENLDNSAKQGQAQPNMQQALEELKANPQSVLAKAGLKIPNDMNDAQQIINYLLQSGQVSNPRLQMAQRLLMRR